MRDYMSKKCFGEGKQHDHSTDKTGVTRRKAFARGNRLRSDGTPYQMGEEGTLLTRF
jgi:hypothetical protein